MAAAMILPPPQPGKKSTSSKNEEVSGANLSYARTVKRLAPELVPSVIGGSMPPKDALRGRAPSASAAIDGPTQPPAPRRAVRPPMADLSHGATAALKRHGGAISWKSLRNLPPAVRFCLCGFEAGVCFPGRGIQLYRRARNRNPPALAEASVGGLF
jgi:hypothetical protein